MEADGARILKECPCVLQTSLKDWKKIRRYQRLIKQPVRPLAVPISPPSLREQSCSIGQQSKT
jgi:hypothetical protein